MPLADYSTVMFAWARRWRHLIYGMPLAQESLPSANLYFSVPIGALYLSIWTAELDGLVIIIVIIIIIDLFSLLHLLICTIYITLWVLGMVESSLYFWYKYAWLLHVHIIHLFDFVFFFYFLAPPLVPSAPPQDVSGEALSAVSIQVTWRPPPKEHQNGNITGYKILSVEAAAGGEVADATTISAGPNDRSLVMRGLRKWTEYKIWVLAHTRVGNGPKSRPIIVRTEMDGTYTAWLSSPKLTPKRKAFEWGKMICWYLFLALTSTYRDLHHVLVDWILVAGLY